MRICAASARASAAPAASPQASARRAASSSNGAATRAFWWLNANETARWSSGSATSFTARPSSECAAAVATPAHPDSRALQASGCLLGDRSVGPTKLGQIDSGLLEVVAEDLVQLDEALPVLPQPLREAPVEVGPLLSAAPACPHPLPMAQPTQSAEASGGHSATLAQPRVTLPRRYEAAGGQCDPRHKVGVPARVARGRGEPNGVRLRSPCSNHERRD